jgi:hypothetical protein
VSALTIEVLQQAKLLLDEATPKVGLYSSEWYPRDGSVTFTTADGEVFHIAHPDVWRQVISAIPRAKPAEVLGFLGLQITDLDTNHAEASRVFQAMAAAMLAAEK